MSMNTRVLCGINYSTVSQRTIILIYTMFWIKYTSEICINPWGTFINHHPNDMNVLSYYFFPSFFWVCRGRFLNRKNK